MSQAASGRIQQKQRTRAALLKAARELLAQGTEPTIQTVADHAMISRATAYRYYSATELLLQEAVLDGIASSIEALHVEQTGGRTIEERVDKVIAEVVDFVLANEGLFRAYLRTAVTGEGDQPRGGRRLTWLRGALGTGNGLPKQIEERLLFALALLTGIETVVVAKDICGFDDRKTRAAARWAAQAVLRSALVEAAG